MKKSLYLLLLILSFGVLWADPPTSKVKGLIILTSASGLHPRNVLFSDLVWTDFYGGSVTGSDGQQSIFANKDIGKIIYFDPSYYTHLDSREDLQPFRAGLQVREVVANTKISKLVTDDDFKALQDSESALEDISARYPTAQPLLQPQIDILKDDISHFSSGQRMVAGKWVAKAKVDVQVHPKKVEQPEASGVSITTRDGKTYTGVGSIQAEDDGVTIIYNGGVDKILYENLPLDIQKQYGQDPDTLAAKKKAVDDAEAARLADIAEKQKAMAEQKKADADAAAKAKAEAENEAAMERKRQQDEAAAEAKAQAYAQALAHLPKSLDVSPAAPPPSGTAAKPGNAPGGAPAAPSPSGTATRPGNAPGGTPAATPGASPAPEPAFSPIVSPNLSVDTATFPGATFSYDIVKNVCYFDSPQASASPVPAPSDADQQVDYTTLTFRNETDGNQPQHPDKITATLLSILTVGKSPAPDKLPAAGEVIILVNGASIPISETKKRVSNALSNFGQVVEYNSFILSPEQARSIANGKSIQIKIGDRNYAMDQSEASKLQRYFAASDKLPSRSSFVYRKICQLINQLPPFTTIMSDVCMSVICGSFFLIVLVSFFLFMVATRFFKW